MVIMHTFALKKKIIRPVMPLYPVIITVSGFSDRNALSGHAKNFQKQAPRNATLFAFPFKKQS